MNEARNGTQDTPSTTEACTHGTAASRNRFGPDLPAHAVVHNWILESHPADGNGAHATREESIEKERNALLRATANVCKTGHIVLVVHWSPSDTLNRQGTWPLEIFDCRFVLWGEFGLEAHEQCISLSKADDIVKALAKAMVERWEIKLSMNGVNPNPICEWNTDKQKLLHGKYNERSLPSLREIERELRPLVVYTLGRLPVGRAEEVVTTKVINTIMTERAMGIKRMRNFPKRS